jgi:alkylation response protein AidB-like acyl-CoA dehydrogenase
VTSSYVVPACSNVCAIGLRVHGGIGFTWEHDSHLYLKRAKLDEVLFGSPSWHRRRLANAVFPALVAS